MTHGTNLARDELTLRDYLAPVRKRIWMVLIPMLVLPLVVELDRRRQTVEFRSKADVLMIESEAGRALEVRPQNVRSRTRQMASEVELALSDEVRMRVEDRLGVIDRDVLGTVTTEAEIDDRMTFRARADSRQASAELVNTWAETFLDVRREAALDALEEAANNVEAGLRAATLERSQIPGNLDGLEYRLDRSEDPVEQLELRRRIAVEQEAIGNQRVPVDAIITAYGESAQELEVAAGLIAVDGAVVMEKADPKNATSTASSQTLLGLFAVAVGALLGFGLAMLVELLDSKVRGRGDFGERGLPLEVLALVPAVPKTSETTSITQILSGAAPDTSDAFDRLRAAVAFLAAERDIRSIAIGSPTGQRSKTWAAVHLASAFAAAGRNVILVDASERDCLLTAWSKRADSVGQPDHNDRLLTVAQLPSASTGSLRIALQQPSVRNGRGNEPAAIVSDSDASVVLYDAPPILTGSDSVLLASRVDAVLLIAEVGVTVRADVDRTATELERAGGRLIGVALVGAAPNSRRLAEV